MTTDSRGRIRFTANGFRFEILKTDPTTVRVYDRFDKEKVLGTIDLLTTAFDLLRDKRDAQLAGDITKPVGVGGYY